MTRTQRRSKSRYHNGMKQAGCVYQQRRWWRRFTFRVNVRMTSGRSIDIEDLLAEEE